MAVLIGADLAAAVAGHHDTQFFAADHRPVSLRGDSIKLYHKSAAYRTIIIGARTQYAVKVSACDYDFLMQWKWTYAVSHPKHGGLVYARRSIREGDRNVTILMHRVIIVERMGIERPSLKHFTDHDNGDSLDNRRVNDRGRAQLAWLTAKENMAKQYGIRSTPVVQAFRPIMSDIPF